MIRTSDHPIDDELHAIDDEVHGSLTYGEFPTGTDIFLQEEGIDYLLQPDVARIYRLTNLIVHDRRPTGVIVSFHWTWLSPHDPAHPLLAVAMMERAL